MRMKTDSRERGHDAVEGVKDVVLVGSASSGPVGKLAAQQRMDPRAEITHRHTFTFTQALHTPRRVPHGGGLKGRHAHGELEAHGGCSERYGSRVRENDGR